MRQDEHETLRKRFRYRCGYCGVRERDAGAELTVDHFHPRSRGGLHEPENWVYCCHACNEFKGEYWQPESPCRILHPLREDVNAHLMQDPNGLLIALTETGGFHLDRLHLNRPQLVEYRRERRRLQAIRSQQARRLARLKELEQVVERMIKELEEKYGDDQDATTV